MAVLNQLGGTVRFSGFERVPEPCYDLIRLSFRPDDMDDLIKVPTDEIRNRAEGGTRHWVDLANLEVPIDQIDSKRRLIQKGLKLGGALAHRGLRPRPLHAAWRRYKSINRN